MKKIVYSSLLAIFCSLNVQAQEEDYVYLPWVNNVATQDSLALVALYEQTNGENWRFKWDLSQPIKQWRGVKVEEGRVTGLTLLNNNLLGEIPKELGNLEQLRILRLEDNYLTGELPKELGSLTELELLDVRWNRLVLKTIPKNIEALKNGKLQFLETSGQTEKKEAKSNCETPINRIYNSSYGIPQIEFEALLAIYDANGGSNWWNAWCGNFDTWHGIYTNGTNVTQILLNDLTGAIPSEIGNFSSLQTLDISNNELTSLPTTLTNLTSLQSLIANDNQFTSFPAVTGLVNLTSLQISNNQLTVLPDLTPLYSLERLLVSDNDLTSLPISLTSLINLKNLSVHQNDISVLPELKNLINLQTLEVGENQLTSIPDLSALTNMQRLYVYRNQLTVLPDITNLTNLTKLEASNNQLITPPDLTGLTELEYLTLYDNQLTASPDVSDLTRLENFYIYNNQLTSLPDLTNLTRLRRLYVQNNQLTSLPDLSNLNNLRTFYLYDNQLTNLPDLSGLTRLNTFWVYNNLLTFEDIFPFENDSYKSKYNPQGSTPIQAQPIPVLGQPYTIDLGIDQSIDDDPTTTNTYVWSKDGQQIATTNVNELVIPSFSLSDVGSYGVTITNSTVTNLTLTTEDITVLSPEPATIPQTEIDALIALYNATEGDNWTNSWDISNNDPSTWDGVIIENSAVIGLSLSNNNLVGSIPSEIENLTKLAQIDISDNQIVNLPLSITNLSELDYLAINNNQLTFEDIEPFIKLFDGLANNGIPIPLPPGVEPPIENYIYIPQNLISIQSQLEPVIDQSYTIDLGIDQSIDDGFSSTNTYEWYKNGGSTPIATTTVNELFIPSFSSLDIGDYTVIITNNKRTNLTLTTENIIVGEEEPVELPQEELAALKAFYQATDGDNWENSWDIDNNDPTTWQGVTIENGYVTTIELPANKLKNVAGLEIPDLADLPELITLDISENELEDIADFSQHPTLKNLYTNDNFLTFEDVIPNTETNNFDEHIYYPQADVELAEAYGATLGEPLVIYQQKEVEDNGTYIWELIDENITGSTYQWYYQPFFEEEEGDPEPLKSALSSTEENYIVTTVTEDLDDGNYLVEVENPLAPELTLSLVMPVTFHKAGKSYRAISSNNWWNYRSWEVEDENNPGTYIPAPSPPGAESRVEIDGFEITLDTDLRWSCKYILLKNNANGSILNIEEASILEVYGPVELERNGQGADNCKLNMKDTATMRLKNYRQ